MYIVYFGFEKQMTNALGEMGVVVAVLCVCTWVKIQLLTVFKRGRHLWHLLGKYTGFQPLHSFAHNCYNQAGPQISLFAVTSETPDSEH